MLLASSVSGRTLELTVCNYLFLEVRLVGLEGEKHNQEWVSCAVLLSYPLVAIVFSLFENNASE